MKKRKPIIEYKLNIYNKINNLLVNTIIFNNLKIAQKTQDFYNTTLNFKAVLIMEIK